MTAALASEGNFADKGEGALAPISTACPDWAARLEAGELPINPALYEYAETEEAGRVRWLLGRLRIPDAVGTPRLDDAGADWFLTIAAIIAGSLDEVTGERIIKETLILIPKKNGKTSLSALFMLAMMLMNRTPRKVFNFIAPTVEVANLAFSQAAGAVELSDKLKILCHIQAHRKTITNRQNGAVLRVVPFTPRATTGLRGSSLIDELHVIAGETGADRSMGQVVGATVGDPAACVVHITTQSERPPAGVFKTLLDRARKVRDGEVDDPGFLPVTFEPPPGSDPTSPSTWRWVSPNLGRSITIPRLQSAYAAAKAAGAAEERRWLSQHCNQQMEVATGEVWDIAEAWAGLSSSITLQEALEGADLAVCGIDVGGSYDLSAAVALVRSKVDGSYFVTARGWATEEARSKRPGMDQTIIGWENAGEVRVVEPGGDAIEIGAWISQIASSGVEVLVSIDAYGPPLDLEQLAGIPEESIIGAPGGWRLNPAILTLERWVSAGLIRHDGSGYLADAIANAAIQERGEAKSVVKRSQESKIDALSALLGAIYIALHGAEETKATAIDPWTDPVAAADVQRGDVPMGQPPTPGDGYVRLA